MGLTIALITESNNQLSEPDTRSKLGHYPLINLTSNSNWVTLLEARVGTDLSDLATEVSVW